jgi:DNA polymerase III sliding clamp (beta) subunit (PCNA family)
MLNGVHLEGTKTGLTAIASDGRILAMVEDITAAFTADEFPANVMPANAENGASSATVPVTALLSAVKSMGNNCRLPVLSNVAVIMGETVTTLGTTDLETPTVSVSKNIEGVYPNYLQVIPKDKATLRIAFSPKLLMKACKIAAAFGLDSMNMEFTTELCPVKITGSRNGQDLTIVVMPMRI